MFKALHLGVKGLAGLAFVLMLAIFVAGDHEAYRRGALTLLPPRARARGAEVMDGCASVLRRWFTGQLLVMGITSAMTVLALGLLRVDCWIVIALLTGLLHQLHGELYVPWIEETDRARKGFRERKVEEQGA